MSLDNTKIRNLEEIKEALNGERLLIVADQTGLSYPTVNKLATGEVNNYSYDTVKRISIWLNDKSE